MSFNSVYERDLLYPTESLFEPGSIHIEMLSPDKNNKIPVIVESRTAHSPMTNIGTIIRVMQNDIFDRVLIDIKSNVLLYIKVTDESKKEYKDFKYMMVVFSGDRIEFKGVNEIEV